MPLPSSKPNRNRPKFAPRIETLEKYSEFGLVTRTEIARQFANLARDATNFEPPVSDESWQAKTWDNLRDFMNYAALAMDQITPR